MSKKDLNKMTLEELEKEVEKAKLNKLKVNAKGLEYCIIRTYSAGVFFGLYDRKTKGKEGTIVNSRRIWYWDGANSLSQLANEGTKKPNNCKFAQIVSETDLKEIIEVIPCTDKATENIQSVKVWEE